MKDRADHRARQLRRSGIGHGLAASILLVLLAPLFALIVLSFWTQQGFAIDRTPTLANYWSLIEPSETATVYFGIPFYLKNPVPAILLLSRAIPSTGTATRFDAIMDRPPMCIVERRQRWCVV